MISRPRHRVAGGHRVRAHSVGAIPAATRSARRGRTRHRNPTRPRRHPARTHRRRSARWRRCDVVRGRIAIPSICRHQPVLGEELLDRQRRQFHAQHRGALRGEPDHVQRLAGQRHEDPAARQAMPSDGQCLSSSGVGLSWWKPIWLSCQRWCQNRVPSGVLHQVKRRTRRSARGDSPLLTSSLPLLPRPAALAARMANAPQRVGRRNYWTSRPSTFCQPRGSSPPRRRAGAEVRVQVLERQRHRARTGLHRQRRRPATPRRPRPRARCRAWPWECRSACCPCPCRVPAVRRPGTRAGGRRW